jgi:citrate lyase subunit beta/citryl-CoA lyase
MPASNARALEKAKALLADALIFDLEDAVAPDAKDSARARACEAAGAGGYGRREIVIRVNGSATLWGAADLAAVAGSGAHAVLLPKVEDPEGVREALRVLAAHGAPESLAVWCMLETPSPRPARAWRPWSWAPPTSPRTSTRGTRATAIRW